MDIFNIIILLIFVIGIFIFTYAQAYYTLLENATQDLNGASFVADLPLANGSAHAVTINQQFDPNQDNPFFHYHTSLRAVYILIFGAFEFVENWNFWGVTCLTVTFTFI